MRFLRLISLLVFLVIAANGVRVQKVLAQDDAVLLRLDDLALQVGEVGIVNARLDCGTAVCSAFALTLRYDPDVVEIIGIELGGVLGSMAQGQVIMAENIIDPARREVRLAAAALGVPSPADDVLFRLTIRAIAPGATLLFVTRLELGDASIPPNPLTADQDGGLVTVGSAAPTATITPFPTEPISSFNASPLSGFAPLIVQFNDTSTGQIVSRLWNFGDGNASSERSPQHTFTTPGIYNVILTVTGPGGSSSTSTRQITVQEQVTRTRTPTRIPTNTAVPPTNTSTRRATSAPSATQIGIPANLDLGGLPLASFGSPDIGPINRTLFSEADQQVELYSANVDYENFAAQVEVQIPTTMPDGWNFAFLFRTESANNEYRLIFSEDGANMIWVLRNRVGDESETITQGTVARPIGGTLPLSLFVLDDVGIVFWNNRFLTTLDLSARRNEGDVRFATDLYSNSDGLIGSMTFSGFSIWAMERAFGPTSGSLVHSDDTTIKVADSNLTVADFIAQTTFSVPYTDAAWDIGYLFRDLPGNDEFRIIIESDSDWLFYIPSVLDASETRGELTNLRTGIGQTNTLTLIALDDRGIVLLNGVFVIELDLSARTTAGSLSAATGMVRNHEVVGESTDYSNYRVWRAA